MPAKLEDQRYALLRFLEWRRPQGSSKNSVTVVFDGQLEAFGGMTSAAGKIIFSQGESADEKIKKIVAQAGNKKNIIVVTDDRDVQYAVRALGAKVCGVKDFLGRGKSPGSKQRADGPADRPEKYISQCDESNITSEMRKIWLKPGGTDGDGAP